MELSNLPKITKRGKKRRGRGTSSGKGKTAGRGTKGQKAREKIKFGYEGGQLPLLKRLPMRRGKGRNISFKKKSLVLNIKYLNLLAPNTVVDIQALVKKGLVAKGEEKYGVKILGEGSLGKSLTVKLPCSKGAARKIEEAGGKVVLG